MSNYFKISEFRLNAVKFQSLGHNVDSFLAAPLGEALKCTVDNYHILRKSIDSRRGAPELIYSLIVETDTAIAEEELTATEAAELLKEAEIEIIPVKSTVRPVIIGAGPAGIFAALVLARAGAKPLLLEKGASVEKRAEDIANFMATRNFSEESNYLIGEGGAGTFSDGKLYTRNRDSRGAWILAKFVEAGADKETLYLKRPHLGSDKLPEIVKNLRNEIIALGGEVRFGCSVEDIINVNGECRGVKLSNGEIIDSAAVMLACGLGGRKLTMKLLSSVDYELKNFQIGTRIEHPQEMVDFRQFRVKPRPATLGAAEYNLVLPPDDARPGVSTFCMCPGGEIIPATAFGEELSSNGMSNHARDGKFANTALVVTPRKLNFKDGFEAFEFLSRLGKKAYLEGGCDYSFPGQDATGFLRGEVSLLSKESSAQFGLCAANISGMLPNEVSRSIREALKLFEKKWPKYIKNGKFIGLESCISSPIRFIRGESGESSVSGLFPCGEGAGMAGGIMSAAVDGVDTAQKIIAYLNKI